MRKYLYSITKINNKVIFVILFFLVLAGLYLRLQKMPSYWDPDFARIYLVPYHIVKYHEFPIVGQYANGSNFYYPPFMEYLLAGVMLISTNIQFIIGFIALIHSLSIITVYFIGYEIYGSRFVGLISGVLFTFSSSAIYYGRSLAGNSLMIPFALLSFYLFLRSLRTDSSFSFIFSYILLFFGALLNYALVLFAPVYAYAIIRKKKKVMPILILTVSFFVCIISLHLPMLRFPHEFNYLGQKIFKFNEIPGYLVLFFDAIFFSKQGKILGLIAFTVLFLCNLSIDKSVIKKNAILIALFILTFLAVVIVNNKLCCRSYYAAVYPFFFIFSAFLTVNLFRRKNLIAKTISVILVLLLILSVISEMDKMYWLHYDYVITEKAADKILTDVKTYGFVNFNAVIGSPDHWYNPALWYFLEVKTGKKFIRMVNNQYRFKMQGNPEILYVYWNSNYEEKAEDYLKTLTMYNTDSKIYEHDDYVIYRLFKKT